MAADRSRARQDEGGQIDRSRARTRPSIRSVQLGELRDARRQGGRQRERQGHERAGWNRLRRHRVGVQRDVRAPLSLAEQRRRPPRDRSAPAPRPDPSASPQGACPNGRRSGTTSARVPPSCSTTAVRPEKAPGVGHEVRRRHGSRDRHSRQHRLRLDLQDDRRLRHEGHAHCEARRRRRVQDVDGAVQRPGRDLHADGQAGRLDERGLRPQAGAATAAANHDDDHDHGSGYERRCVAARGPCRQEPPRHPHRRGRARRRRGPRRCAHARPQGQDDRAQALRPRQGRTTRTRSSSCPRGSRGGTATLAIAANDAAGNRRLWTRSVRVPSASTRPKRSLAALAAAPTPCRARITAAGHTWAVSATNGFPCAAAGPIVRKLAAKTAPPPVGRYPGTHAGLVCVGRLPGKKPSLIICGTRSRGFTAVRT